MIRRSVLTGAALLVSLVVLPATASSAQAHPNVVGTGITHCNGGWTGKLTFTPPLINAGVATTENVTLTATAPACALGVPVPTSAKLVGKGVISGAGANNCAAYFATPAPPGGTDILTFGPAAFGGAITWTPVAIASSSFGFGTAKMTTTALAAPVTFTAPVVTVTGSYPTGAGKFKFNTVKTLAVILGGGPNCAGAGLSKLRIAAAGSKGKF
jgi:hypothetical protein